MKIISLSLILIALISCSSKDETTLSSMSWKSNYAINFHTSKIDQNESAKTHENLYYSLTNSENNESPGESFSVTNKSNKLNYSISGDAIYFSSLIDSFLILDCGTGNLRELNIVNLNTKQIIYSSDFMYEIKYDEKSIIIKVPCQFENQKDNTRCNSGMANGVLNKQIIDLHKLTHLKTGYFECYYLE